MTLVVGMPEKAAESKATRSEIYLRADTKKLLVEKLCRLNEHEKTINYLILRLYNGGLFVCSKHFEAEQS